MGDAAPPPPPPRAGRPRAGHTGRKSRHSSSTDVRMYEVSCMCVWSVGRRLDGASARPPAERTPADARYSEYDADALLLDRPPPPRRYIVCRERENTVNGFGRVCLQLRLEG